MKISLFFEMTQPSPQLVVLSFDNLWKAGGKYVDDVI